MNAPEAVPPFISPALAGAQPVKLWNIFDEIRKIPRRSGNEGKVMDWIESYAELLDLEHHRDAAGNVSIKVPATPGYEHIPPVILQGHSDMVCLAQKGVEHDFDKDPIEFVRDGDVLKANGTTLGADNGIGISAALALATDSDSVHPSLEILITVDEEVGLKGATNLDPTALQLTGTRLLNLDTETLGEVCISSAGLDMIDGTIPLPREAPAEAGSYFEIELYGFPGGHSGVNIKDDRGNPIMDMARIVHQMTDVRLVSIDGGDAMNAISTWAKAVIFVPAEFLPAEAPDTVTGWLQQNIRDLYRSMKRLLVSVKVERLADASHPGIIQDGTRKKILAVLADFPQGVRAWSKLDPRLVGTSANLGVARTAEGAFTLKASTRSENLNDMAAISADVRAGLERAGFTVKIVLGAEPWQTDPNAPIVKATADAYRTVSGKEPQLTGVHGGLEAVSIVKKLETALRRPVEAATFGPTITNAHSPTEAVEISTVAVFYEQLKEVLRMLATTPRAVPTAGPMVPSAEIAS